MSVAYRHRVKSSIPAEKEVEWNAAIDTLLEGWDTAPVEWEKVTVWGPDIEDKHTLGQLARMTANAYAMPGQSNWWDLDMIWNTVRSSIPHFSSV